MKKHLIALGLAGVLLGLYSCQDKNAFTIEGTVKNSQDAKKIFLLRADTNQVSIIDSAELSADGKFKFKNQSTNANLFKLRLGKAADGAIFDLIAKNGDAINFDTDLKDSSRNYKIEGSQESEKIREFNAFSDKYSQLNTKLVNEFQVRSGTIKNRDSLLKIYQPQFEHNMADFSQEVLKFINNNKTSLAGFYAAMSLDPYKYEQQLVAYADDIKGKFDNNAAVQQFIKQMEAVKPLSIGHKAPEFTLNGIDGKLIKLTDYKGKYVMLDFWASWCVPCRQENPNVVKLYNQYKGKGLNILGISLDDNKADWQKAIDADKLTWAHGSDLQKFEGPAERLYHIEAIPSNFIIDPQGNIVAKNITGKDLEDFLTTIFAKL